MATSEHGVVGVAREDLDRAASVRDDLVVEDSVLELRETWGMVQKVVVVGGALGLLACTELAPGSDRLEQGIRTSLPDAGMLGDPSWACLDRPIAAGASRLVDTVVLSLAVVDTNSNTVPEGLSARACPRRDVLCETPVGPPVGAEIDGAVHLPVRQGFDGYVEITSPLGVSTMYFLNRPLMTDTFEGLPLVSRAALGGLAQLADVVLDANLGHLLVRAFDCVGGAASGVELSTDASGAPIPFVFVDGLPVIGEFVTSDGGIGGFVNVPVGYAVVQGRRLAGNRVLGTANVVVRPGWFTYGDVEPLPQ